MTSRRFGRAERGFDPRVPHLSALLAGKPPPPPPAAVDWTAGLPADLGQMLNDKLNDCSCAAFYHALQVWGLHAQGVIPAIPDGDVEALYRAVSGYGPGASPPGPTCSEQTVLTYLLRNGAPTGADGAGRNRLSAFVEVDPRHLDDVKRTIAECGVAYIGFKVPRYLDPPPPVWDVQTANDTPIGGHAVVLAGYDADGAKAISWGRVYTMNWAFFAAYVDEVYALADPVWIGAKGTSPGGLGLAELEAQMKEIKEGR